MIVQNPIKILNFTMQKCIYLFLVIYLSYVYITQKILDKLEIINIFH